MRWRKVSAVALSSDELSAVEGGIVHSWTVFAYTGEHSLLERVHGSCASAAIWDRPIPSNCCKHNHRCNTFGTGWYSRPTTTFSLTQLCAVLAVPAISARYRGEGQALSSVFPVRIIDHTRIVETVGSRRSRVARDARYEAQSMKTLPASLSHDLIICWYCISRSHRRI